MRNGPIAAIAAWLLLASPTAFSAFGAEEGEAAVEHSGVEAPGEPASEEEATLARIAGLATQGGARAAEALAGLLRSARSPRVRVAALEALEGNGLRSEEVRRAVRQAKDDPEAGVRWAALSALGRLGDGRDVPDLLEALRSPEGGTRSVAFSALGQLSDRRLPASPTRCAQWWDVSGRRAREAVRGALEAMPDAVEMPRRAASHRSTLAREGWVDVPAVTAALKRWIHSPNHALRAEALHAIGALRIASLVDLVAETLPFVNEADVQEGVFAAERLGLSVDGIPRSLRRTP